MNLHLSKIFSSIGAITISALPMQALAIDFCSANVLEGNSSRQLVDFVKNTLPSDLTWVCTAEDDTRNTIYVARNDTGDTYLGYTINERGQLCLKLESVLIDDLEVGAKMPTNKRPPCSISMM